MRYIYQVFSNLGFRGTFVQDFLREMSERDEKIKSLVNMGFSEDEANEAIIRCGMPLFEIVALMVILSSKNYLMLYISV